MARRRVFTTSMVNLITKLALRGHHAAGVARIVNGTFGTDLDEASVRAKCAKAGIALRMATNMTTLAVQVDFDTLAGLRHAARERGLPVPKMVSEILSVLTTDRLVAAVMDDVPAPKAGKKNPHDADSFRAKPNGAPVNAVPTSG